MVRPQFSPSHLYTWAKGNVLHLHIETSIILWSFQRINFIYFLNLGFFGGGPIKMLHCPMPRMYFFATNTFAPSPKKRLSMVHKVYNSKKVSNLCVFINFFSFWDEFDGFSKLWGQSFQGRSRVLWTEFWDLVERIPRMLGNIRWKKIMYWMKYGLEMLRVRKHNGWKGG